VPNLFGNADVLDVGTVTTAPILPWRVEKTPLLRIGGAVEATTHQFMEISAASVMSDGSILVADGQSGLVRRYGTRGDFLQQFGGVGEGPGEFRAPAALAVLPGDTAVVWDRALWRTSVFDGEGHFVRVTRYAPTATGVYPMEGMWPAEVNLARGGTLLVRLISKDGGKGTGSSVTGGPRLRAGLAIHREGERLPRLLATVPASEEVEVTAPWGVAMLPPPLAGRPKITFHTAEGRACLGHQRTREILCLDDDGRRIGVRWADAPKPVDPRDPAILRWRTTTMRAFGGKVGTQVAEEVVAQVSIPASYPAFGDLLFDSLGYLWIDLGPSDGALTEREYLVLDSELVVVGRLKLPTMDLLEIGTDYVLGVRRDSVGVEEAVLLGLLR